MSINRNCSIQAEFLERWMTVGKLKELLSGLKDEWEIEPNQVGNLTVVTKRGVRKGFIDFNSEIFEKIEK